MTQPGRLFRFKLAALLGKTFGELHRDCDSRELSEWEAVNRLWPIDQPRRQELSAGIISMLIHNAHIGTPKPASEFMRDWGEEYQQPVGIDPQAIADKVDAISLALTARAGGPSGNSGENQH